VPQSFGEACDRRRAVDKNRRTQETPGNEAFRVSLALLRGRAALMGIFIIQRNMLSRQMSQPCHALEQNPNAIS
jgi:hypothetical protein